MTGFPFDEPFGRIVGSLRKTPYSDAPDFGLLVGAFVGFFVGDAEGAIVGFEGAFLLGGFVTGAFEMTGAFVPSGGFVRLGGRTVLLIVGAEVSAFVGTSTVGHWQC